MKKLEALLPLLGSILLILNGCATAHKPAEVDLSPAIAEVQEINRFLDKAIASKDLQTAKPALVEAKKEVVETQEKLIVQETASKQLEGQRDWWKNDSQNKDIKITSLENRVEHLQHLLFLCSALISIVAGGIGWALFKNIPYGAWITGGIVIITFTSAWFALGHLL